MFNPQSESTSPAKTIGPSIIEIKEESEGISTARNFGSKFSEIVS